jgi:hypothetical protein
MRRNRESKYVGRDFGGWLCVGKAVSSVGPSGKKTYGYSFGKGDRIVSLDNRQAAKVYSGDLTVDQVRAMRAARYEARNAR